MSEANSPDWAELPAHTLWTSVPEVMACGDVRFFKKVKHRRGFPGESDLNVINVWGLVIGDSGFSILKGVFIGRMAAIANAASAWQVAKSSNWSDIHRIEVTDLPNDRVNKGALLTFGVLGIGASISQTGVTITTDDGEFVFQSDGTTFDWSSDVASVLEANPSLSTVFSIGEPAESSSRDDDPMNQIERLGSLLEKGLITQDEFDRKKRDLLDRL